jgi:hypothetical protein
VKRQRLGIGRPHAINKNDPLDNGVHRRMRFRTINMKRWNAGAGMEALCRKAILSSARRNATTPG